MITLALETSTPRGGVAMFRDGELIFSESFTADRSHSSDLFAVIERALATRERPGRIVVGLGPGSYAGVRIAIAAGIGISVATGAEMVGVPSIVGLDGGEYLAVGDARRGGYWVARVADGEIMGGPEILTREGMEERLATAGMAVYSSEEVGFAGVELRFPDVERIGRLGVADRGVIARGTLEPMYLREPHITTPKGKERN
jgi:tRNA threonylcarbamoyladenosine biosynthesis protein TsaB